VLAEGRFRQPVRLLETGAEAGGAQLALGGDDVAGLEKEVQILRLAVDPGVLVDRVRPLTT
jgi:hypothetical protein